jgi:hypothetical protein
MSEARERVRRQEDDFIGGAGVRRDNHGVVIAMDQKILPSPAYGQTFLNDFL